GLPPRRGRRRGDRDRGEHEPVRPEPARHRLVGRARLGGLDARVHPAGPRCLRGLPRAAAPLPLTPAAPGTPASDPGAPSAAPAAAPAALHPRPPPASQPHLPAPASTNFLSLA